MKEELIKLLEKWVKQRQYSTARVQYGYSRCIADLEKLIETINEKS